METEAAPPLLRGICSAIAALTCVAAFVLVWARNGLSHETRDLVSFAAFVVFVVSFNETLDCLRRCRR
jgi:hypothetical protein